MGGRAEPRYERGGEVRSMRMTRRQAAIGTASAAMLLPLGCGATARRSTRPEQAYDRIVRDAIAAGVPGMHAYVRAGGREWTGVAGFASIEQRRPLVTGTRMRVASLTKLMTYAVTMMLVRAGRLRLEQKVAGMLPAPLLAGIPYADEITVAQLLDHRSGLYNFNGSSDAPFFRDLYDDPRFGRRRWRAEELLDYARRPGNRPDGRPGAGTWYSSTGYILLELVLERVTGRPLHALYRRLLFGPLGMTGAGVEGEQWSARDIAQSYAVPGASDRGPSPFAGRKPVRADGLIDLSAGRDHYNAWARGAGAVALPIGDLARFMAAMRAGRIQIFADQANAVAATRGRPRGFFDWNGGSRGIQATILYAPAPDVTVIVVENGSGAGPEGNQVARQLLDRARDGAATG